MASSARKIGDRRHFTRVAGIAMRAAAIMPRATAIARRVTAIAQRVTAIAQRATVRFPHATAVAHRDPSVAPVRQPSARRAWHVRRVRLEVHRATAQPRRRRGVRTS
jgi:hypothetical protein